MFSGGRKIIGYTFSINFYYISFEIDCLKRLTAILFLLILLFNLCGYRYVISRLEKSSEILLEKQVDTQAYNDDDLISVKTKLNLPYYSNSPTYERAYGSININGKEYEYVKRRIYQDTLELLCLPNHTKTQLSVVDNELTRLLADGQASLPFKKSTKTLKISLLELFQPEKVIAPSEKTRIGNTYILLNDTHCPKECIEQPDRPPQA